MGTAASCRPPGLEGAASTSDGGEGECAHGEGEGRACSQGILCGNAQGEHHHDVQAEVGAGQAHDDAMGATSSHVQVGVETHVLLEDRFYEWFDGMNEKEALHADVQQIKMDILRSQPEAQSMEFKAEAGAPLSAKARLVWPSRRRRHKDEVINEAGGSFTDRVTHAQAELPLQKLQKPSWADEDELHNPWLDEADEQLMLEKLPIGEAELMHTGKPLGNDLVAAAAGEEPLQRANERLLQEQQYNDGILRSQHDPGGCHTVDEDMLARLVAALHCSEHQLVVLEAQQDQGKLADECSEHEGAVELPLCLLDGVGDISAVSLRWVGGDAGRYVLTVAKKAKVKKKQKPSVIGKETSWAEVLVKGEKAGKAKAQAKGASKAKAKAVQAQKEVGDENAANAKAMAKGTPKAKAKAVQATPRRRFLLDVG